jgi:hypothetical protein
VGVCRSATVVAVLALHGCSYLMIDRPPRAVRKGDQFPACTEDNTFPWIDVGATALAAAGSVLIYSGVAKADTDDPMVKRELTKTEKFYLGSLALVEGAFFALSAYHGFSQTKRCRDLQPAITAAKPPAPPPPYAPPWTPATPGATP